MNLLTLIAALFVAISFLLAPCTSEQVNVQKSLEKVHHAKFALPSLSRKLILNEKVKSSSADKSFTPDKKFMKPSSGTKQHQKEENVIYAAEKETWKEKDHENGPNKSEYFTMDYGWVRKRRPIHNKKIPFVP
ncbi:hypothetical protein CDL12_11261 [Handroanthus impetiginosus]|uniref:Uncharacterized protein n=1 Tax=Handroanthus impetiginosus TaxID=429701 RepID=A0A2G9HEZ2_9LAMI|nr:hypothetical protein CDL12_11261 [Handroanthus impetiginosus]